MNMIKLTKNEMADEFLKNYRRIVDKRIKEYKTHKNTKKRPIEFDLKG